MSDGIDLRILKTLQNLSSLMSFGSTLKRPNYLSKIAVSVPSASTLQEPFTVFDTPVGGGNGARLSSLSLSIDQTFQNYYYWQLSIDSVTAPNPPFMPFDPNVSVFDIVSAGNFYLLKPGSSIQIKAYNNDASNTADGIISVYVAIDMLTYKEYNSLFGRVV